VIYEVYVRSFADADGDGMGDLAGIRSRLGYLSQLGIDALWLTPCYPSPQADGGYDVADYRDVDPRFGTLADMDALIADAHQHGLRVIVDLVPNHTSDEHPWFRAALAAAPGSAPRRRYLFRDGRGPGGDLAPNDWQSTFGGGAWTRVAEHDGTPGQWYLHLFDTKQPDLDWTNEEVRAEFRSILRFWLDRGVDGFRVDVAHGLAKDPGFPDVGDVGVKDGPAPAPPDHPHWDQDEVHDVYRDWRRVSDSYDGERVFVGEAWVATPERLARYVRADELHTAFNFEFLLAPWDATALRAAIDTSIEALGSVGAPATWVLSNHDVVRHVTRYGGGEQGRRRARAAALLMFALPGGAYVYQGEELGLPEVEDLPDEVRQDPTFRRTHGAVAGRDGCRVPLPWSGDAPPFGFGPAGTPWLPQPAAWATLTAAAEADDPASMLSLYRDALARRRQHPALGDGTMSWLPAPDDVLAFRRPPRFACVVNLGASTVEVSDLELTGVELLLASAPIGPAGRIPPTTTVWLAVDD
jgi:alpha-glucosidase